MVKLIFLLGLLMCRAAFGAGNELTCYSTEFAPYVISQGNRITGVDVEVISEAARRAGLHMQIKLLPWVRLENELKRGKESEVACAFAYTHNDSRTAYMDFMQVPLKYTRYVLFAKKGRFPSFTGIADLKGMDIGLRRGFVVPGGFEEMRKRKEVFVQEVDDDLSNFRKLAIGRIAAIITNADAGQSAIAQLPPSEIVMLEPAIVETPTYLVLNKGKQLSHWLAPLDAALQSMQQDGSIKKVREKYLTRNESTP